jgi:hypothetical protein
MRRDIVLNLSAKIFSPPELMVTESRPSNSMRPSGRILARSPEIDHRTPSIVGKVPVAGDQRLQILITVAQTNA